MDKETINGAIATIFKQWLDTPECTYEMLLSTIYTYMDTMNDAEPNKEHCCSTSAIPLGFYDYHFCPHCGILFPF